MFNRILEWKFPKRSFFIFGPRQTGKSTLLKKLETKLSLDLLKPETHLLYTKAPSTLAKEVLALREKKGWILIDEVQRVPQLLDVIHSLMEEFPHLHFVMSGSSARKLRRGASNLLGGRALYRTLHPLTYEELDQKFDLETVLSYGSLPKIYLTLAERDPELAQDLLRSYVTTYLEEEIKSEALVRNLQGFQNFIDVAAAQFSEQVNLSEVGKQCLVPYATVREYYSILEDTLIGFFLFPYLKSFRKRMSHAPKFYFFDNGVTRAILGQTKAPPSSLEKGRLFEQWMIQEVNRINRYFQKDWKLTFWRTSHGAEVDLLLEQGNRLLVALEFKFKRSFSGQDFSGLQAFKETHPKVPVYLVGALTHKQRVGSFDIFPALEMLEFLKKNF